MKEEDFLTVDPSLQLVKVVHMEHMGQSEGRAEGEGLHS